MYRLHKNPISKLYKVTKIKFVQIAQLSGLGIHKVCAIFRLTKCIRPIFKKKRCASNENAPTKFLIHK